ncbi:SDR family NAD(P)-dependent oxidoreductase [Xenorhabdus yunnanensis]|uniref:SDR family NAD(P)-dependent oxidoreductase n=1 Tax=Xenorhabdus yunnanensis TaxID=3025878 RepID=UPI0040387088
MTGKLLLSQVQRRELERALLKNYSIGGATVIITGRQFSRAKQTAQRIDPTERCVIPMEADVRDHLSVKALIDNTVEQFGGLHMLVNNAGITGPHGINICDYSIDDWNDVINTDLSGTFFGLKYGIPAIIQSGGGAIVNLSSSNGIVGIPGIAPYTTAKHGVLGLTRSVALEFADKGIVNRQNSMSLCLIYYRRKSIIRLKRVQTWTRTVATFYRWRLCMNYKIVFSNKYH